MPFRGDGAGQRVTVIVNVDSSPQPYARLERAIVEDGQQFGTQRTFAPPQTVPHLGLDASWFPDLDQLLTSDGHVLLGVTVQWPGVTAAARAEPGDGARAHVPRHAGSGVGEGTGPVRLMGSLGLSGAIAT